MRQIGFVHLSAIAVLNLCVCLCALLGTPTRAHATAPTTFRQPHPLAWQHQLPTGEMPGWSSPWWFEFETSVSNTWNAPLVMTDKRNGREYRYTADFEQISAIAQFGRAINDRLGVTIEVPYAYRSGGGLDSFIDSFHVAIGNRRYNRQYYPKDQDIFSVKTDGIDYYSGTEPLGEISNIKAKLKWWAAKWNGKQKGSCPCGLAVSAQAKVPMQDKANFGTTGDSDFSALAHIGFPLFTASAVWFTGGVTWLGDNPAMANWPRNTEITLYEMSFDLSIHPKLGLVGTVRAESPFLQVKHLQFEDVSTDPAVISRNRAASGWNSLVRWRGSSAGGVRYRTQAGNQWQILLAEDWGVGPFDAADNFYSNGAPDVTLVFQSRFEF